MLVFKDLRVGFRMLVKDWGFTTGAIIILALGLGANAVVFSVVNTSIILALPYRNPDQLVQILTTVGDARRENPHISIPDIQERWVSA